MLQLIKYRCQVLHHLLPFSKGIKRFFIINLFCSVALIVADFIIPLLYKEFIEETIIGGKIKTFIPIVIGYLIINGIVIAIGYIVNSGNNRIQNHVTFQVKYKIWNNLFKRDFTEYESLSIGDEKMHMEDDIKALSNFSSYYTIDYLISYVTMIACSIILFTIEWRLALFSLICIPITFYIDYLLSKKEMQLNSEQRENDKSMNTWLYNSIQGWKEIKALNLQKQQKLVFVSYIKKYALYYAKWINYWTLRVLIIPKIRNEFCMQFGLYFIGGLLIMKSDFSIGSLLVFAIYFNMLTNAINVVSSTDSDLQGQKPYLNRVFDMISKQYSNEKGLQLDSIDSIVLKDVHYSYGDKEVLKGINYTIRSGDRIAITGKSGCGKTTLLKAIVGMIEPTEGQVLYSNIDLKELDLAKVQKKIGYVMQNNYLYNMSIKDNLLFGNANATMQELIEACKKAYIYEYIAALPEGFNTVIGEGGKKLSGGQRQRLVLARCFLRDLDVFIFDEATSALDQYSENIVNDAITSIGQDKIIIIVAHRESSIALCNRRIEMDRVYE